MASSKTVGQTVRLWETYGSPTLGFPFDFKVVEAENEGAWSFSLALSSLVSGSVFRFYAEEMYSMGMNFGPLLMGHGWALKEFHVSYPASTDKTRYESIFGCPVTFNAAETLVIVSTPTLDRPVKGDDSELSELCIRHCCNMVRQLASNGLVTTRLRGALRAKAAYSDETGHRIRRKSAG